MALDLGLAGILISSGIATLACLFVAYGIAGWYERRSRRRRERRLAEKRAARQAALEAQSEDTATSS